MSMLKVALHAVIFATISAPAFSQTTPQTFGFGAAASAEDLAGYFAIPPDGRGLPPGSGTAMAGAQVYAEQCSICHGDRLQGVPEPGIGGDRLIGGRDSLRSEMPIKTVESYWPYATTLFDYVKRAMPFTAPGSLSNDQLYSVLAYILSEGKIVSPTDVIDADTLPRVKMPNQDGFVPDSRPEQFVP